MYTQPSFSWVARVGFVPPEPPQASAAMFQKLTKAVTAGAFSRGQAVVYMGCRGERLKKGSMVIAAFSLPACWRSTGFRADGAARPRAALHSAAGGPARPDP